MIVQSVLRLILLVISLLCNLSSSTFRLLPVVPCPDIFRYVYSGLRFSGEITLTHIPHVTTTVLVTMTIPGTWKLVYAGELSIITDDDTLFDYITSGTPIKYRVDFPLRIVIPRITDITVNNVRVCSGPTDYWPSSKITLRHITEGIEPNQNIPEIQQVPMLNKAEVYGTVSKPDVTRPVETAENLVRGESNAWSLINAVCGQENTDVDVNRLAVNGQVIAKARFPWIVAIYTRNFSSLAFQCGGSLISTRTVVSAAHCFYGDVNVIPANRILMSLGRHNLSDWQNAINVDVDKIVNHPDFRSELTNFDADVSIVHLKTSVSFSVAVRPICLYNGPTDFNDGAKGIIVGWGEDETHTGVTAVPKLVNVTIVSELDCIRSNEKFLQLTSNRTLCAGNRDGSGPCRGDSGSGLMLRRRGKWMLRGTVSSSLVTDSQQCDLDAYVVYSDIAKFQDWIESNMIL